MGRRTKGRSRMPRRTITWYFAVVAVDYVCSSKSQENTQWACELNEKKSFIFNPWSSMAEATTETNFEDKLSHLSTPKLNSCLDWILQSPRSFEIFRTLQHHHSPGDTRPLLPSSFWVLNSFLGEVHIVGWFQGNRRKWMFMEGIRPLLRGKSPK